MSEDLLDLLGGDVPAPALAPAPSTPVAPRATSSVAAPTPATATPRRRLDSAQVAKRLYSQYYRKYHLLIEYKNLGLPENNTLGVYVMRSEKNDYLWHGVVFVTGGFYTGGVFKFNVEIPDGYPDACPVIKFTTAVFHPLVHASSGVFSLKQHFEHWRPYDHTISKVLKVVARSFREDFIANLDDARCPNRDAINLYRNNPEEFQRRVNDTVRSSQQDAAVSDGINFAGISTQQQREAVESIFGPVVPILSKPL